MGWCSRHGGSLSSLARESSRRYRVMVVDGGLTIIKKKRKVPLCSCKDEITKNGPSVKYIASVSSLFSPSVTSVTKRGWQLGGAYKKRIGTRRTYGISRTCFKTHEKGSTSLKRSRSVEKHCSEIETFRGF